MGMKAGRVRARMTFESSSYIFPTPGGKADVPAASLAPSAATLFAGIALQARDEAKTTATGKARIQRHLDPYLMNPLFQIPGSRIRPSPPGTQEARRLVFRGVKRKTGRESC